MRKVLLVCDGNHFPQGAFTMAKSINAANAILLTGVFLNSIDFSNLWFMPVERSGSLLVTTMQENDNIIKENTALFAKLCTENNIAFKIHAHEEDSVLPALKKESRFSDLMLLSSELFYANINSQQPNSFTRTGLHASECPVLLVPENVQTPSTILLSYNETESSVYAIKQFTYLFPEWTSINTMLVFAGNEEGEIPNEEYIREFLSCHFERSSLFKLEADPRRYFATWAEHIKNGLVVSGSFGRSNTSRLFKKSFISELIRDHAMPLFIAHQ